MTDNEIGYQIYLWERKAYGFIPVAYSPEYDYTPYLNYFKEPADNERLKQMAIDGSLNQ